MVHWYYARLTQVLTYLQFNYSYTCLNACFVTYLSCMQMTSSPIWKFVLNLWNAFDIVIIAGFVYSTFLFWQHTSVINPALDALRKHKDDDVYLDAYWMPQHEKHEDLILGIVVAACWIKVTLRPCLLPINARPLLLQYIQGGPKK